MTGKEWEFFVWANRKEADVEAYGAGDKDRRNKKAREKEEKSKEKDHDKERDPNIRGPHGSE